MLKEIKNPKLPEHYNINRVYLAWYSPKNYFSFFPVLMPKGKYSGQKLIKLVSTNITAKAISTIPIIPVNTFVKNKIAITAAISILITLSIVPMFFFIVVNIKCN
jgi:hypothetical protein